MPTCDNKLAKDMSANEIHESTKKKNAVSGLKKRDQLDYIKKTIN